MGGVRQRDERANQARRPTRTTKQCGSPARPIRSPRSSTLTELDERGEAGVRARPRCVQGEQYGDALVYFHMGYALAPDLPGFLRELGSTYDKLGATDRKREFYRRYLVQRPFGANADVVRSELARDKDVLGTLLVSSSLPCTELWVNRQRITGKLPEKGLLVAPGSYKGLCFNPKYEMALFEYATVEPGKPAKMTFRWAIIVNKLERPLGRIALENPKSPGTMIDLGITSPEVGVAVPADGHKLKMVLKDDSGATTEERSVQIEPGQKLVVVTAVVRSRAAWSPSGRHRKARCRRAHRTIRCRSASTTCSA